MQSTHNRLAVDLGGRVCGDNNTNDSSPDRILAVEVEEYGPTRLTLLHANSETPPPTSESIKGACLSSDYLFDKGNRKKELDEPCAR